MAGPCAIESEEVAFEIAEQLSNLSNKFEIPWIFKGSYRKANRSRLDSFTGIGDIKALEILQNKTLIEQMDKWGVIPELECFDTGMINMANHLISKSILKPPFYFNVILGNLYNSQSDILSVANVKHQLPENSITTLGGIGIQQLRSNIYGLMDFDGIRIGLEDNLMFRKGEKATNSDLIKRIHRIMTELDLELMSSIEFKKLGYENRNINNR
jgi:uncharacterized protein (DUF849 family)